MARVNEDNDNNIFLPSVQSFCFNAKRDGARVAAYMFPRDSTLRYHFTLTNDWHHHALDNTPFTTITIKSTFLFYESSSSTERPRWSVVHCRTRFSRSSPPTSTSNFISLDRPRMADMALSNEFPIVCCSMNHVGWIEGREDPPSPASDEHSSGQVATDDKDKGPATRFVLMLVTLPDALEHHSHMFDPDLREKARELDIPSDILCDATHLWMNPAMGTITVVTHGKELNVYTY